MKTFLIAITALVLIGCSALPNHNSNAKLLPKLQPYVHEVASELALVPAERRAVLDAIAAQINTQLQSGTADLTFICTHNSRRSHMSQIWAQTAAYYYGLDNIRAFSGGTQTTACNCRTITAMRTAGFAIEDTTTNTDNPVYLVRYAENRPAIRAYSKLYNADGNPAQNFIALMTCSIADKSCPIVEGSVARFAIHYADPRLCDDTPTETTAYNERCREIAREMFYIMSQVRNPRATTSIASRQ